MFGSTALEQIKLDVSKLDDISTLHELVSLALKDLREVERNGLDKHKIDMDTYHTTYDDERKCSVCLAGCIFVETFSVPSDVDFNDISIDQKLIDYLRAINFVRQGKLELAYYTFYGKEPEVHLKRFVMAPYGHSDQTGEFKKSINQVITYLRGKGV